MRVSSMFTTRLGGNVRFGLGSRFRLGVGFPSVTTDTVEGCSGQWPGTRPLTTMRQSTSPTTGLV